MVKRICPELKIKICEEISNSIYEHGPKYKCSEIKDRYVPNDIAVATFYRWVKDVKVSPPSQKMVARAQKEKEARKSAGKSSKLDDRVKIGTLATQGFSGIDQYGELQKTLTNVDIWSQEITKKYGFDQDRTDKASNMDIEDIISGASAIAKLEAVRVSATRTSAQIFVQLMDHDRLSEFNRRWLEIINEISPEAALKIARESKKMLNEWGSIPL